MTPGARVERIVVAAYTVPTDRPESDGTFAWEATTLVLVEAHGGGRSGLGWTYAPAAVAQLVHDELRPVCEGADALDPPAAWAAMTGALRNAGHAGLTRYATAAVDVALHDLRARLLGLSLAQALGRVRERVPVYGSGGFTSYDDAALQAQLAGWADAGITQVKMKIGREPARDPARVRAARAAIGPDVRLMVDANGACTAPAALRLAERLRESDVTWFEEPVSSDHVAALRRVRDHAPPGMEIAAGEYASDLFAFDRLVDAVDVLQGDVTRCGGITGLLPVDALCRARGVPFSAHCAPSIHAHACAAMPAAVHLEYFHDHVRIERLLFDGVLEPDAGALVPDPGRPGLGLELRRADAERFRA